MRRAVITVLASLAVACGALVGCSDSRHSDAKRASSATRPAAPGTTGPAGTADQQGASGRPVTFAFGGDVHFVDDLAARVNADPTHVLASITPVLSGADLAMVNLETAVTDRGEPVPGKNYHFRSPAASFTALRAAGVDVVNMANNHALDYGPVGMQDTFDAIAASKMPVVGIGHNAAEAYRPYRTVLNGERIAILSALDWLEPALIPGWSATDTQAGVAFSIDRARLVAEVRAARPNVDTLVVFLHWGTEETHCASGEQQELARALLDAGADIVVGSHAHRVFGAGHVGASLVAYGLGNFVYWREDDESGRSGVLLVQATGRQVDSYSWAPARITQGVPVPQNGGAAAADVAEWEQRRTCSGLSP